MQMQSNLHILSLAVELDGVEGNDTSEDYIMIGEEGMKVAHNISNLIKQAAQNGSLRFSVNSSEFVPDIKTLNISDPQQLCYTGQIYRNGYCRKSRAIIIWYHLMFQSEMFQLGTLTQLPRPEKLTKSYNNLNLSI